MRVTPFGPEELEEHVFLNGRVRVHQPIKGFRSGSDAILVAAAVPAKSGDSVLELGCGAGLAALCLAHRVPGLSLSGIEIQPGYAALARANARAAGVDLRVHEGDVAEPPPELKGLSFDQVFCNPPFFEAGTIPPLADGGKDIAFRGTELHAWIDCGLRRLREGGWVTIVQRIERLPELLSAVGGRAGDIRIKPVSARTGRDAQRFILKARKGARGPMALASPLIMHDGSHHESDFDESHSQASLAIHRDGRALES